MPSELEELIEFLHHGNSQIRQVASEHLVGYSAAPENLPLFKAQQLTPITDLKLLVRDYAPIAKNALTILVNLSGSGDREILANLARDEQFREEVLARIVGCGANLDLWCGLLVNLGKDEGFAAWVVAADRQSVRILDQLMDCFVRVDVGSEYDYLSYFFADVSLAAAGREYLLEVRGHDSVVPVTKLIVFLEGRSLTRRKGVASTVKNVCFEVGEHSRIIGDEGRGGVGLLPYVLLPLAGNEEFDEEDSEGMLSELQLLPPDKEREKNSDVIVTLVETLLLLTTTRKGRDRLRAVKVYPIIRALHEKVEVDAVREVCERLVYVLMGDEAPDETNGTEADEDHKIEEVL